MSLGLSQENPNPKYTINSLSPRINQEKTFSNYSMLRHIIRT